MAELWVYSVSFWRTLISLINVRSLVAVWILITVALLAADLFQWRWRDIFEQLFGDKSAGPEIPQEVPPPSSSPAATITASAPEEPEEAPVAAGGYTPANFERLPREDSGESGLFMVVTSENSMFQCASVRKIAPDYVVLVLATDGKTVRLKYENIAKVLK